MNEKTGYPLCWPEGRPRTSMHRRRRAAFKTSFGDARNAVIHEINLLNGTNLVISSDIPRRNDGLPSASEKPKSGDPGIACYFTRKGKQLCFACDCYLTVDHNMQAIAKTIEALRGIARWGTGDMMEAAFRGFAALPERASSSWFEVLGVAINASEDQVKDAYRILVKKHHPDVGGDPEMFMRVQKAMAEFENRPK